MTLSRRDRAACVLALECLRQDSIPKHDTLRDAEDVISAGATSWYIGGCMAQNIVRSSGRYQARLLRARWALYLRALLRADRGDFGPWASSTHMLRCNACGENITGLAPWLPCFACKALTSRTWLASGTRRMYRSLWEQAGGRRG